ncbi:MAG: 2-amino-4-hydroxy-6-hydroxymethyldihydropteridine diphosphokinase [Actinomycetota bacterium]|nr:2-amino-4-hydroxy-6-hydroxymethyldihydropteridine diphosphokinase [Actinomycetota bacterium]
MYVFIGLGSNMGDRLGMLTEALSRIDQTEHTALLGVSRVYESEPWGAADQPLFANAAALLDTELSLDVLLEALKDIESEMGRDHDGPRNGPRVIDLDILLAGDEEWETENLTVPHPRMAERDFVITPLLELAPYAEWPDGTPVTREKARVGRVKGVLGRVPAFEDRLGDPGLAEEDSSRRSDGSPRRSPLPGEEWLPVFQYGREPGMFMYVALPGPALGAHRPSVDASFAQMVLDQMGVPHEWDPFPPDQTSDPYGFSRRFRLMVPASMAAEAQRTIAEATSAPIDWTDPGLRR